MCFCIFYKIILATTVKTTDYFYSACPMLYVSQQCHKLYWATVSYVIVFRAWEGVKTVGWFGTRSGGEVVEEDTEKDEKQSRKEGLSADD